MTRILIAEDEPRISSFIDKGLSANGFAVTVVADGRSAYGMRPPADSTCWCSISWPARDGRLRGAAQVAG